MKVPFKRNLSWFLVLILVCSSFMFCSCASVPSRNDTKYSDKSTDDEASSVQTDTEGISDYSEQEEISTSIKNSEVFISIPVEEISTVSDDSEVIDSILFKNYEPTMAFFNGTEVNLESIFGKDYQKYNDGLTFNDDGTFTMSIGVTAGPKSTKGTYTVVSNMCVELTFDNNTKADCMFISIDSNGFAVELRIKINDYYVIFSAVR